MSLKSNCFCNNEFCNHIINENEVQYLFLKFNYQLLKYIKKANVHDLIFYLSESQSINFIKQFPYEILTAVARVLNQESNLYDKKINNCCKKLFQVLAINCEPSELLLYMMEQIELNFKCCCYFLHPLEICLSRIKNFQSVIDICINLVERCLHYLSIPGDQEGNEIDEQIMEYITLSFMNLSNFINNLLNSIKSLSKNDCKEQSRVKSLILHLSVSMFGKPLCFINLDYFNYQLLFHKILKCILFIQNDIFYFFRFINYDKKCLKDQDTLLINTDTLAFCNLYWNISYGIIHLKVPQVYNPYYIVHSYIYISNYLLTSNEKRSVLIIKALDVIYYIINVIEKFSILFESPELAIHNELIRNLINIIICGNTIRIQKYALNNFIQYIDKFSNEAKYIIIKNLIISNNHPFIMGIVIRILKNIINESLISEKDKYNGIFSGFNLQILISNICKLKKGYETNIVEISDQLIMTLNFILYLVIRDKKASGDVHFFEDSNYQFLKLVKEIVAYQKAQWIMELNLIQEKKLAWNNNKILIFINELSHLSSEQKNHICNQAINTLLLIENILKRIHEFIDF